MTRAAGTPTDIAAVRPIGHDEGMRLFACELERNLALLTTLSAADWAAPTDCPDWDVRLLYAHVLGACESGASPREFLRQFISARAYQKSHGGPQEAALSAVQVAARSTLAPAEIVARLADVAPRTVRGRTRLPALVRRARITVDGPVAEKWTVGYLVDVVYLRDAWMHRIDASRATTTSFAAAPDHDGRIVADIVREWAARHGQPFALELAGPAGGSFIGLGGTDEPYRLDAIEFCRILAGRSSGTGLLATVVPF